VKKTLFAMLSLGALAMPASPAVAGPIRLGCGYGAMSGPDSDTFTGRLYGYGAFVADDGRPETATIRCTMSVRGELAYTGTFTGTGLVAGSVPVEFTTQDPREVEICESADWGTGYYDDVCYVLTDDQVPAQEPFDLLDTVLAPVAPEWRDRVCDTTRLVDKHAPGVWGTFWTNEDGDVFWDGHHQFWYC
jgi:hypothetical protein